MVVEGTSEEKLVTVLKVFEVDVAVEIGSEEVPVGVVNS